ncbi:MAG: sialidase family protein, partial [Planctomycetota bacterium]|nr:sialidase family protein [Planctomycetota bacterium]
MAYQHFTASIHCLCAGLLAGALLTACGTGDPPRSQPSISAGQNQPQPTDPRKLRHEGSGEDHAGRDGYREQMHRAPDGVDWRAVEAANWDREHQRRLALVQDQKTRPVGSRNLRSSGPGGIGAGGQKSVGSQPNTPGTQSLLAGPGFWEEVGSRNQAGHTRCAALGPELNGQRSLYVGSAGGGLWSSPDGGTSWSPLSDSLFGGVDEVIALAPPMAQDPDVLVIRRGTSLFRSVDGGLSWLVIPSPSGLTQIHTLTRLYDGNQTLLMLTRTTAGLGGQKTQLFRSQDLGASFQLLYQAPSYGNGDLWTPQGGPGAGTQVFMALRGQLYRSDDGGATFPQVLPLNPGNPKCHITGSEQTGPTLYVTLQENSNWRLYRSDDGGSSAVTLGTLPDYWGSTRSMVGFASNAMDLVYGGVNGHRSSDGGLSFQDINGWGEYYGNPSGKLHADLRGLDVIREDLGQGLVQDRLYFNTDGGTYLSTDNGLTVQNLSLEGLGVGQFYDTHTSALNPSRIVGGTQDQGYQHGLLEPYFGKGPSTALDQLISGDYGHLVTGDGTHELLYSTYPGFILIQRGETNPSLLTRPFPAGANNLWLPPLVEDPTDVESFYFLADRLWRYSKTGLTWNPVQHSSHDFSAGPGSYLSAMAIAPTDSQRMYAVTDSGR